MIVVGVDPSLSSTGVAVVDLSMMRGKHGLGAVRTFTVKSAPVGDGVEPRRERLVQIADRVVEHAPAGSFVVIEAMPYAMRRESSGRRHERSGLWWMIADRMLGRGCRVVEVAPSTRAKYATGDGRARKGAVLDAVRGSEYGAAVRNHDEADAFTLACFGARVLGSPIDVSTPMRVRQVERFLDPNRKAV